MRDGRQIRATAAGKGLIHSLPEIASTPDMTARWETELDAISQRKGSYNGFMQPLQASLHELIAQSQAVLPEGLKNIKVSKTPYKKRRSGKIPKKTGAGRSGKRNSRQRVTR